MSGKSASNTEQQVLQSFENTRFDYEKKRFSLPRQIIERKVTLRPYESFRDHKELSKRYISFGFAALSSEEFSKKKKFINNFCEQPVGAQADLFISSLNEKSRYQIKKFLENSPRQDYQHFMWIKDHRNNKFTVVSIKTLENHLNSDNRVRRVQWRHLSSERVSIYRYSIPVSTYEKSKLCKDCIAHHKKLCLLTVWLSFVNINYRSFPLRSPIFINISATIFEVKFIN
uniref:Uncharacterized protein n=1 Tax=Heterorhabditis bacteriophora TaxID=37862 RepID=A0A1I7WGS8_HETBA